MTDLNTAVFLTLCTLQALPCVLMHVYVYHVLWNRMDAKVWSTAVRASNDDSTVKKYFMSFLFSTASFAATILGYLVYISSTTSTTQYYPALAVCAIALLIKYYSPNVLLASISAIFAVLYLKHFYPNFFMWHFINECAIIIAYIELLVVNVLMNKSFLKTFKSVNANA